ncbi:Calmodulin and related proteins (EF-Hand superfamily) [Handroanthus impetiginosus]|uniref:Calmodulin and related proteins (EF-Hand superfamily) n=1 Tax=Handroanthus impetiginosus TaxID=429701 RepID=A0A2G9I9E7_9LAMI|nr:Calmodulin and related proteins (EF-Hand superfamily) [Handroanthus impetiginosus]
MKRCASPCERVFNLFDEDKDGKITPLQLQNCIALIGGELTVQEAEMMAEPLVSDEDGLVGLDEFSFLVESESEEEKTKDMRKAFEMYKMEGDECITPRGLEKMLRKLGDWSLDECLVMISHFDLNGDGALSFQEFELMMTA